MWFWKYSSTIWFNLLYLFNTIFSKQKILIYSISFSFSFGLVSFSNSFISFSFESDFSLSYFEGSFGLFWSEGLEEEEEYEDLFVITIIIIVITIEIIMNDAIPTTIKIFFLFQLGFANKPVSSLNSSFFSFFSFFLFFLLI